jgi:DNA/RNA endonuclease G (NUC1)
VKALGSAFPPVPSEMKKTYPFERFPSNPGIIQHVAEGGFIVGYNPYMRSPQWVIERITKEGVAGPATRKNVRFYEDPTLPESLRVGAHTFQGYSRSQENSTKFPGFKRNS